LQYRGHVGHYWSSSEHGSGSAWNLRFGSGDAVTCDYYRPYGLSVRCISE